MPTAARLQIHQVALLQIDDLVGHAGQGHGVAGQKILALPHPQHQGRTRARAHHAVRLVLVDHRNGKRPMQPGRSGAHGLEQVAVVQAVHQVRDDLGVRLARKHIAARLQLCAQLLMVLDDAVVHQGHTAGARRVGRRLAATMAEMRVGVVHHRRTMRGPARVGDAGGALQAVLRHLLQQLGHARRAARAPQAAHGLLAQAGLMHGHAAGVVAAVFQPLQALHQDGNDVARGNRADDAAHKKRLLSMNERARC